ncbi:uncharacterized protein LOC132903540 [Amyelois transitella]|uniref:uncharacterized protein LOC132903540 n=1 Tax=Amyelois transitella TaxID=680683 RepID=UPI00298FF2D0|nr:uncharacterized protein LOC132903540 [Amyelois transitella]
MITNVGLMITGDTTSIHDTVNYIVMTQTCCQPGGSEDPRCIPIPVAEDDLYLRNTGVRCLNLTRAITYQSLGCVPKSVPNARLCHLVARKTNMDHGCCARLSEIVH